MISKLTVKNVKCFDSQEFTFNDLTVFCGANASGKSTAIQCLLLLRQANEVDGLANNIIPLIGQYISIGHISDLISHFAIDPEVLIMVDDKQFSSLTSNVNRDSYNLPLMRNDGTAHDFFENDFLYLCAERLGPRNSYDVQFESKELNLGIFGQFSMSEFEARAAKKVENHALAQLACAEIEGISSGISLEIAVKTVMRKISPGFDISAQSFRSMDKVANTFGSSISKQQVRPVNTGFGVSYVFPIIVGAFCIRTGGTFIIENPEVHLHPQAQSELAIFLAQLSLSGVQVILETHSDHIINGIRVATKSHEALSDGTVINSIKHDAVGREVKAIRIDADGNLTDYQEGFFDQAQKDLLKLF